MTMDVLIIRCYETVFFANYSIFASSCCLSTNIYYVTILIGFCPHVLCLASLKCTGKLRNM